MQRKMMIALLMLAVAGLAQQPVAAATNSSTPNPTPSSASGRLLIPPGTKVVLSLVRPVSTRTTKLGSLVYLQTSAPIVVGGKIAIPTGTAFEGYLSRKPHAYSAQWRGEFQLRDASLIFANGYSASIPGRVTVVANLEETTSTYPDSGNLAPLVFLGGTAGGAAIGALAASGASQQTNAQGFPSGPPPSFSTAHGAIIGAIIGSGVGFIASRIIASHHGGIFMDVGTPVAMTLSAPVSVDQNRVQDAANRYPAASVIRPSPRHYCYSPGSSGTPGTPDTVIPGTPPTVIPGANGAPDTVIPGTPDTVIPGSPGTPGTPASSYPCAPGSSAP